MDIIHDNELDLVERPEPTKRDLARLKKPVFKTMIAPQRKETEDLLRGWQEPKYAYILFEKREFQILNEGQARWGSGLLTYNVEARAEHHLWKIQEYQKKGFNILHYGNFPKLDDKNPSRREKAKMYSGPKGKNPWDALEQDVLNQMRANPSIGDALKEKTAEADALKARVAEMEAKLSKSKAKDEAK